MDPFDESRDLALRDGGAARVRPLRPSDRDLYERAVVDLSPRSRYLRFFSPIVKPSERLLDQMTQVDGRRHAAHVALSPDETRAIGVVRYIRIADDPRAAAMAIAISDDWQGRGLGIALLTHSVRHARLAGLRSLLATSLRENLGAARLLRASGFAPLPRGGPYAEFRLGLGDRTPHRDPP